MYGICNVVGASIPRNTDSGTYIHVGPEIGVASTKAFTGQVTVLMLLALCVGQMRGTVDDATVERIVRELKNMPLYIKDVLGLADKIKNLSKIYTYARNFLYLGRGYNYPTALEGALKLKEISYIHAEGYPAAEMKINNINIQMIKFSLLGETILEWNDKNIEHYHARRMAMDSMLCRFKDDFIIGDVFALRENEDTYNVGWHFNKRFEGKGFACEAAAGLLDYLFREAGARRIYGFVEDDNIRSKRLCERLGMRREGCFKEFVTFVNNPDGSPKYEDTCVYAILEKEWNTIRQW